MSTRTGVSEATLRMWEVRHGFPHPRRVPSGHRRYSEVDVARVRAVVRAREHGLSLQAAIDLAQDAGEDRPPSVYASLRSTFPALAPQLLSKRAMLWMSRAIEDECLAQASRPLLFGCFQHEGFYRASEGRWRELSRTAERAVVLADFRRVRRPKGGPVEIPIQADDPVVREWAIVCESPSFGACLTGWERPVDGSGDRVFEAAWTVEAPAVRLASQVCLGLASTAAPGLLEDIEHRLDATPVAREHELRSAIQLSTRMVRYATTS
ncbi:MAG TPA: DICT sensory domain-containing protein [Solirubrobacteraceae bacterium]|nr:DICT sensory domain-containing protein [Solirubrobacteraceae bacterium]